jgi:outer membrane lipoprotein-sorting protein
MRAKVVTVAVCFFALLAGRTGSAGNPDAHDIVRRADQHARGNTSQAEIVIRIVRPDWSREMTMKIWSKGNDRAMILVTGPARDKGTAFLKRGKEVWNWIPSIERNIKLPPSMMSQSWMGTDFTNDDLVKEASIVDDYHQSLEGEESIGDRTCYRIRMVPVQDAAVVWGLVVLWIDTRDYLMMRAEYYDEDGVLVSTMTSGDIRSLGGRVLPARMEMVPADKPGNKTVLLYQSLTFDQPIQDDFFSTRNMPRLK